MSAYRIAGWLCLLGLAVGACGTDTGAALPASGKAYRALDVRQRTAVAASCRDRAAARARGLAARELRALDPSALREQLDSAFLAVAEQRRTVDAVCREAIPFVTPGLRISIDGAKDNRDGTFTIQTSSDKRLTISGHIAPPPVRGRVLATREVGPPAQHSTTVRADGRFQLPAVRLRKIADNTFTIAIQAPSHAPRSVSFSAICLDCLAGAPPPSPRR